MVETAEPDQRLRELYDEHRAALHAYCRRRLEASVVPDAVSDIFLTVWRRIDDVPADAELPWMYGVARNVISNHLRSGRRRLRLASAVGSQPSTEVPGADVPVVRRAEERLLLQALSTLSPADQELLRLRAWEELSSAEIGVALDISASAVDMRLTRAKRRLQKALRSAGYFESVSSPRIVRNGGSS
ncbi:MAG TPA: sigma-70 family RNA polymerase sigma factor [Acidimicrobiia bacterium]|nr:sigma-70 family RNA polymerase sigma factor [Acidimicrobiia bacterium]